MPLPSRITYLSTLQQHVLESFYRVQHMASASVTTVTDGLPRKRGAEYTRVKPVLCQGAQGEVSLGLKVKRLVEDLEYGKEG